MKDQYSISASRSMSEDIRQIAQAFLLAKKEFVATGKSARNDHQKYTYAKIEDIYRAVEDALMKQNIIIWHFSSTEAEDREVFHTRLVHVLSGQFIEDSRYLISEKPGNQAKGAANTYMKKYALLSLCAISAEDDDSQEEERYIAKRALEPKLTPDQIKMLQDEIKLAPNKAILYSNILKFNRVKDLSFLPVSSFDSVKNYIQSNRGQA